MEEGREDSTEDVRSDERDHYGVGGTTIVGSVPQHRDSPLRLQKVSTTAAEKQQQKNDNIADKNDKGMNPVSADPKEMNPPSSPVLEPHNNPEDPPPDTSMLPPEILAIAHLAAPFDPNNRNPQVFGKTWMHVYQKACPKLRVYLNSKTPDRNFLAAPRKQRMVVPKYLNSAFVAYRVYLHNKYRQQQAKYGEDGGDGTFETSVETANHIMASRVEHHKQDGDEIGVEHTRALLAKRGLSTENEDRRQRRRLDNLLEPDVRDGESSNRPTIRYRTISPAEALAAQEEWHEGYINNALAYEEDAGKRWQNFCRYLRDGWTELTNLRAFDMNPRWPHFQENQATLWQSFLDKECDAMMQVHQNMIRSAKRSLRSTQRRVAVGAPVREESYRYANMVDRFLERRKHRLESALDRLFLRAEQFLGYRKSEQLSNWNGFLVEIEEECDEFRYLERGVLKRHLKDCRRVLDDTANR